MTESEQLAKLIYTTWAKKADSFDPLSEVREDRPGQVTVLDRLKLRPRWEVLNSTEQAIWYSVASTILESYAHKPAIKDDDQECE